MHYELMTVLDKNKEDWKEAKNRIKQKQGQVLSIFPSQTFKKDREEEAVQGKNIFDLLTKRTYEPDKSMFFNKAPVPAGADIFVNEDWSISINHEGEEIGVMSLFPHTRRLVRDIKYLHADGKIDYVEEYNPDGKVYSNIFYFNGLPEELHFYDDQLRTVISYFFYQGKLNYLTVNDPETGEVLEKYPNLEQFIAKQVAKLVTKDDEVVITRMGNELIALSEAKSYNILYLSESPLDERGEIRGNLKSILKGDISYVQEVRMTKGQFDELADKDISLEKVKVSDD